VESVAIVTSDRSVSLQRVANDLGEVLRENGVRKVRHVLAANADPRLYADVDTVVVVMTFDPAWAVPYFFLAWERRQRGNKVIFYTTIEGRVRRSPSDEWVYRDLEFVANSNYTKSKLEDSGAKVTHVVYHGVNIDSIRSFGWRAGELRKELGLSEEDFVVGYVAGGYMRKGHDLYAEVIKVVRSKDPAVKFVVLTDERGAKYYEGVDNAVVIPDFGKLPLDTVYTLYHVFDLYAQPSLAEGFCLPVLESLASGKPVVHADYPPLNEVTTPSTSFRVRVVDRIYRRELGGIEYELHYYDPREFAEAILHAKEEVVRGRLEYRHKCVVRASKFDFRKTYKKFLEI